MGSYLALFEKKNVSKPTNHCFTSSLFCSFQFIPNKLNQLTTVLPLLVLLYEDLEVSGQPENVAFADLIFRQWGLWLMLLKSNQRAHVPNPSSHIPTGACKKLPDYLQSCYLFFLLKVKFVSHDFCKEHVVFFSWLSDSPLTTEDMDVEAFGNSFISFYSLVIYRCLNFDWRDVSSSGNKLQVEIQIRSSAREWVVSLGPLGLYV